MHARIGHHNVIVRRPLANESRIVIMRCRTGPHAIVAPRAAIQVDQHRLRAVEEPVIGEEIKQAGIDFGFRIVVADFAMFSSICSLPSGHRP